MSEEFKKYKLPDSWIWTTIGELGMVVSGGTPSTRERQFWDGTTPWLTPADLSGYTEKYISKGQRSITALGLDYSSAKLLPEGSLIFSSRAPIGYVAITKVALATNQGFKNLIPAKSVSVDYIYYYLLSAKNIAESVSSGTTFLELTAKAFSQIPIPLPPIDEQYRIVERIEEIRSELSYGKECLKTTSRQLTIYRLSILKYLFKGGHLSKFPGISFKKPTLLNMTSNELTNFEFYSIPKDWDWVTIGETSTLVSGQHILEKDYNNKGKGTPYLTGPSDFGIYSPKINKWTTQPKVVAHKDSILITVKGSGVGKTNYLTFNAAISRQLMALVPKKVLPMYLYYYLILNQSKINFLGSGSAIPGISRDIILNFPIPLCELDEQRTIVREIETKISLIDKLEENIQEGLELSNSLSFSLLKEAFRGNLIKQSNRDQKAADLIKIIESDRVKLIEEYKELEKMRQKGEINQEQLSVLEVLSRAEKSLTAVEVWKMSKHKENIEEFYAELKSIRNKITEIKEKSETFLTLKK